MINAPHAYSYIRFSTKKQELGDSTRRQHELSVNYAKKHGLNLRPSTYHDLGVSAFRGKNIASGKLGHFLEAVNTGRIPKGSYLLVENLDRLSRGDVRISLDLFLEIGRAGIIIVTLLDECVYRGEDTSFQTMLNSLMIFARAHDESANKSKRLLAAWDRKRLERRPVMTTECPLWLVAKADRSGYDVIADRVDSVVKVFQLTTEGFGSTAIVRRANQEKWAVPGKATTWYPTLVTKLLANRAVLGEYQPHTVSSGKRQPIGESWKGHYPRIIDLNVFNRANEVKNRHAKLPRRRDETYRNIFQGVLFCGTCGASYVRKNKASAKQLGYAIYMCAARIRAVTTCQSLNSERFEPHLLRHIFNLSYARVSSDDVAVFVQDEHTAALIEHEEAVQALRRLVNVIESATDFAAYVPAITAAKERQVEAEKNLAEKIVWLSDMQEFGSPTVIENDFNGALVRINDPVEVAYRGQLREKILKAIDRMYVYPEKNAVAVWWRKESEPSLALLDGGDLISASSLTVPQTTPGRSRKGSSSKSSVTA